MFFALGIPRGTAGLGMTFVFLERFLAEELGRNDRVELRFCAGIDRINKFVFGAQGTKCVASSGVVGQATNNGNEATN